MNTYLPTHGADADFVESVPLDLFGHHFLELRHDLRSMVEQARLPELESVVRVLVRTGYTSAEDIIDEVVSLVGDHVEERLEAVIKSGEGQLWHRSSNGRLKLVEADDVR